MGRRNKKGVSKNHWVQTKGGVSSWPEAGECPFRRAGTFPSGRDGCGGNAQTPSSELKETSIKEAKGERGQHHHRFQGNNVISGLGV